MNSAPLTSLPTTRVPDPASAPALRWGILAPGGIADRFTESLRLHTRQQVVAVGSRSTDRADAFAARHGIGASYGSYEALLADANVEAVYIASPHSEHHAQALAAIAAGKHLLVEKSFTRSADQAREVIAAAAAADVAVMEAMWTRFLPHIDVVRQLLADGAIGEVSTILADHGQNFGGLPATHRLLNPELAGGALLDLGVYPVSFASFAMGTPESVLARGSLTATGVDAQISAILQRGVTQAVVNTTLLSQTATTASISGSAGRIDIAGPFYTPQPVTVTVRATGEVLTAPAGSIAGHEGLCFEAAEFARCVRDGRRESELMPHAETIAIMETMDDMRRQVGVSFPGE